MLDGSLAVDELLAAYQPPRLSKRALPAVTTRISVADSDPFTLVEVATRDAIGLLFAITDALRELDCRIHIAKVSTVLDHVHDVFYLTDLEGRKVTDPGRKAAIEVLIRERIGANTDPAKGTSRRRLDETRWRDRCRDRRLSRMGSD